MKTLWNKELYQYLKFLHKDVYGNSEILSILIMLQDIFYKDIKVNYILKELSSNSLITIYLYLFQ